MSELHKEHEFFWGVSFLYPHLPFPSISRYFSTPPGVFFAPKNLSIEMHINKLKSSFLESVAQEMSELW